MTELHRACEEGNLAEVTRLLQTAGSQMINQLDQHDKTPLMIAVLQCQGDRQHDEPYIKIIQKLLEYPACDANINLSAAAKEGTTSFHAVCQSGFEENISFFITNFSTGKNKNFLLQTNQKGENALHYACKGSQEKNILTLLKFPQLGEDFFNKTTKNNETPFFLICNNPHLKPENFFNYFKKKQLNIPNIEEKKLLLMFFLTVIFPMDLL